MFARLVRSYGQLLLDFTAMQRKAPKHLEKVYEYAAYRLLRLNLNRSITLDLKITKTKEIINKLKQLKGEIMSDKEQKQYAALLTSFSEMKKNAPDHLKPKYLEANATLIYISQLNMATDLKVLRMQDVLDELKELR